MATSAARCKRQPIAISTLRSPTYNVGKPRTPTLMRKTPNKKLLFHGVRCQQLGRRQVCIEGGVVWILLNGGLAAEAKDIQVGSYLPSAPSNEGFVQFTATNKDTPALRADIVWEDGINDTSIVVPPTYVEVDVQWERTLSNFKE